MTRKQNTVLTGNFLLCRQYLIAKRHSYLAWRLRDLCFVSSGAKVAVNLHLLQVHTLTSSLMEVYGNVWKTLRGLWRRLTQQKKKKKKKKHVLAILWVLNLGPSFPLSKQQPVKARLGVKPVAISAAFGITTSHYAPRIKEEHVNWKKTTRGKKKGKWHR